MAHSHKAPAETMGQKPIVLIGMMGAGKSSLGKKLAKDLGYPFHDSDAEIEQAAHMTIADIFATHGEAVFRDGERRVIARLLDTTPQVLAVGGGAFMDAKTRRLIGAKALSVWLNVPLERLLERVSRHPHKRPLLAKGDIRATLERLLEQRSPAYAQADIVLSIGHQPIQKSVAQLRAAIENYYETRKH